MKRPGKTAATPARDRIGKEPAANVKPDRRRGPKPGKNTGHWKTRKKERGRAPHYPEGRGSPRFAASYPAEDLRVAYWWSEKTGKTIAQVFRDALSSYLMPVRADCPASFQLEGRNGEATIAAESLATNVRDASATSEARRPVHGPVKARRSKAA